MNVIQQENARPGSDDWQLTRMRLDGSGYRSSFIEGYCSRQSVKAGEAMDIFVSTQPAARFKIEIFRIPRRSPDLSVMDYAVWKEINKRMRKQELKWAHNRKETREQYLDRLRRTARNLPKEFIEDSIGSMVVRCQRLFKAKGGGYFEEGGL